MNAAVCRQDYMEEKQEAADQIICSNPGALQEFQQRLAEIASLETEASSLQERIDLHLSTIAERKVSLTRPQAQHPAAPVGLTCTAARSCPVAVSIRQSALPEVQAHLLSAHLCRSIRCCNRCESWL